MPLILSDELRVLRPPGNRGKYDRVEYREAGTVVTRYYTN
jgi:hypothetical protein